MGGEGGIGTSHSILDSKVGGQGGIGTSHSILDSKEGGEASGILFLFLSFFFSFYF